jgi:alpha-aminoadipate carrier protein LysW
MLLYLLGAIAHQSMGNASMASFREKNAKGLDVAPVKPKYYQGVSFIERRGIMVNCPECEMDLDVEEDEVDEGEIISCPECGTDFEVITVNPIELKPVEEEGYVDEEEAEETEDGDNA